MTHELIIGRTQSGKTTFATKKALALKSQGYSVIVLDSMRDPRWPADFITDDQEHFLDVVWASRNCAVFIDEAGDEVGKYNDAMNRLATKGRHWGHKVHFICQRTKQISTTVRTQCSNVVIFKQSLNDTKDLADEFVEPMINQAHLLKDGEFIYVRHGQPPGKYNVFEI